MSAEETPSLPGSEPGAADKTKVIGRRVLRPREQVEGAIRSLILSAELKSGERLPPEAELVRQFNVSRTTIREALRSLNAEGLIRKTPGAGGGSFVQSFDHNSLANVIQESVHNLLQLGTLNFDEVAHVRQYLEVPSARLAALNRSAQDIDLLHDILNSQKHVSVDDPIVPVLDARFHGAIANASQNRVLAAMVKALHEETEPVHYLDLSPDVGRETVKQHHAIVAAIEAQDADAAESAIVEHLTFLRHHMSAATLA